MADLRVVVVAADPLARGGLVALLLAEPGLAVSAWPFAEEDGLDRARGEADVLLLDLGAGARPPMAGVEQAVASGVPFLVLVDHEDDAAPALAAGALAVVLRDASRERLVSALHAARDGLIVLDPGLAVSALRPRQASAGLVEPLTPRETEVLQLLAQGLTNKTIAERLGISDHTAKFHVNAILGKLGAESRTEAIVQAARLGLVIL